MTPNIPFNPEDLYDLRLRLPKATEQTIDVTLANALGGPRPEHVFDFYGGIRVVITREQHGPDNVFTHVSGALQPRRYPRIDDRNRIIERVESLVGNLAAFEYEGDPNKLGVMHWFRREENP